MKRLIHKSLGILFLVAEMFMLNDFNVSILIVDLNFIINVCCRNRYIRNKNYINWVLKGNMMKLLPVILLTFLVGCGSGDETISSQDNLSLQDIVGTWKDDVSDEESYTVIRPDGKMVEYDYDANDSNCYESFDNTYRTIEPITDGMFKVTYFEKEGDVYEEYYTQNVSAVLSSGNLVFSGTDESGPWTSTSLNTDILESDFTALMCAE